MVEEYRCPHCGAKLLANAPRGVCPQCLMKAGLEVEADVTLESHPLIEGPGTTIGRYKLLQLIGEGGMGLVYLAEQTEPVKRQVALKIVKPGMDSRQVIARFEAERQVLALLDHPNIAHVFDAGTTETGRPYFAMEYVKGLSITDYCDQHKLSIEDRLKLFLQICYAVQYAHQKGVIHRDIKPSNILVTVQGDMPIPKVIDFGIAKALTHTFTEGTLFTQQGQLLGTPEYMSPEQVDVATQDIDTRSDIYSLGVLLYVLLSGALPFDRQSLEKGGFAALQKSILEEEPLNPSTRLTGLGEEAKEIAKRRKTQVVALAKRLHRELEWIPLKAMRKERVRRYRSASELADDIQNYLNGNPLIAGPETAIYRVKKFVRRHAGSVATVILIAAAIILGLVISTAMYFRSERALQREASARQKETIARSQAERAENVAQEQRKLAEAKAEDLRRSMYVNSIQLADASYREGNIHRVRELLVACPNDLRGWEWDRLNYISDQAIMTLHGHSGRVNSIAISPNGRRIVSGSADKTIKVWDTVNGIELTTISRADGNEVACVTFNPDGKLIASGNDSGEVDVWDASTGKKVISLKGHKSWISSVAFSPDAKRIVSGSYDNTVKVWDTEKWNEVMTLPGHKSGVEYVAYSPDGKLIVSVDNEGKIGIWNALNGNKVMMISEHWVSSVSFSPDSKFIVMGGDEIRILDVTTCVKLKTLRGHDGAATLSVMFSPDGRQIISGGMDNTIKVWDADTGEEAITLHGHEGYVSSLAFVPDGKQIVSGSHDGTIKVWDLGVDRESTRFVGHSSFVYTIAFSSDRNRMVSGSRDGTLKVWDIASGTEVKTIYGHKNNRVYCSTFSPDGKRIASGSRDKTIKVWDTETGENLLTLRGHESFVTSVALAFDNKQIVSSSWDGTIKVWDATTGAELRTFRGHNIRIRTVRFSSDGKQIVSGCSDGTVKLWDVNSGTEMMTLRGHQKSIMDVSFSPDGKRIVSACWDGTIKIWDALTGSELITLRGHGGIVTSVSFSIDGKRILSGSIDRTARVWDVTSGAELLTLRAQDQILSVEFSSDRKTIAAGTSDGSIVFWETEAPASGYELRKKGKFAQKIVDEIHQKQGFYYDVLKKIQADRTLDDPISKLGLQIANSRKWEDAEKLKEQSWEVVSLPSRDVNEYRIALEKAEKANALEANDPSILTTLGVAQYRVGVYQDALMTLSRTDKIRMDANEPRLEDTAFIAMSLHKLGQVEEAKVALKRLRDLLKKDELLPLFAQSKEGQALLAEAEKVIDGEKR